MSPLRRAIIFYIFLLLFLIAAPLVLLYSAGYRYNFSTGRLARVGILVLKSEPRGATITLNNKIRAELTPASLSLAPDEYNIKISAPGFHNWQKKLLVQSQKTTFAENIVLWKKAEPEFLADVAPLAATKDGRLAIHYDAARGLVIFNTDTKELIPLTDLSLGKGAPEVLLAPDERSALVTYRNSRGRTQFLATRLPEGTIIDTGFLTNLNFNRLVWSDSTGALYGHQEGRIFSVNLFTQRAEIFASGGAVFAVRGTSVWSIVDDGQILLSRSRAGEPEGAPDPIVELPTGAYEFLPAPDPYLLLHDTTRSRLLLVDLKTPAEILLELPGNTGTVRINRNGNLELLSWNDFELWRGEVGGAVELLRRESTPLDDAAWHPRAEYILTAADGRIEAIELDQREARQITELARFSDHQINTLLIDPRGAKLFVSVSDGPASGLYSLDLQ